MRSDYENPWRRLPWTLGGALLVWLLALWTFGEFLSRPVNKPPLEKPIDAELVDIPSSPEHGTPKGAPAKPAFKKPVSTPKPEAPQKPEAQQEKAAPQPAEKGTPGGDEMGARAIYSPKPEIPEEYRHDEMDSQVVARFHIAADGSSTVELIQATPIPGLNQAILDTLNKYKFFPALKGGKPVDSIQDWRFRFKVE